jgi:hypothetical protein
MDLTQDQMNFTQDQVDFIAKIIDAKIQAISASRAKQLSPLREFHTQPEIRELILLNLDNLKYEFDYDPFRLQAVIHCLRKLMVLRPADLEIVADNKFRLEAQISGAIYRWDQCPFIQGADSPRHFYWKTS